MMNESDVGGALPACSHRSLDLHDVDRVSPSERHHTMAKAEAGRDLDETPTVVSIVDDQDETLANKRLEGGLERGRAAARDGKGRNQPRISGNPRQPQSHLREQRSELDLARTDVRHDESLLDRLGGRSRTRIQKDATFHGFDHSSSGSSSRGQTRSRTRAW